MDTQELNRVLQESAGTLERFREARRNDPKKPVARENITPPRLRPAIKHIRKQFDTAKWQVEVQVECGCYLSLHPKLAQQPTFKGLQNLIPPNKRKAWQIVYSGARESETFAFWTHEFCRSLEEKIEEPFNAFLKIGLAQESLLELSPVEWAQTLTENLIYALSWTVPLLIKKMCDEQESALHVNFENLDAWIAWIYWRAPKLIHMMPSGNTLYDSATAWDREDAETTNQLLSSFTRKMLDPAAFKLKDLAGEAHVRVASSRPCVPKIDRYTSTTSHQGSGINPNCSQTSHGREALMNVTPNAHTEKNKLPRKQNDLSQYLNQGRLTERQRDCMSLKFEYGLGLSAIADHLSIDRKTADEHLKAAQRKINAALGRDKNNARKARFNPAD